MSNLPMLSSAFPCLIISVLLAVHNRNYGGQLEQQPLLRGQQRISPPPRRALGLVRARTSIQHTAGDVAQNLLDTYITTDNPTWSALTLLW